MNYEYEDDYFPALPDDLDEEELKMMEYLADLHDLENSVPTPTERNPSLT